MCLSGWWVVPSLNVNEKCCEMQQITNSHSLVLKEFLLISALSGVKAVIVQDLEVTELF